ncbi:MAG: choice-of-anchor J domain-containing protein [Bacteroidetes bacterium]|nr:choice-of-anchor J domain-containing protein [Bacteroidota bacterium]MCL1968652.1 choice-of-anchor J domain-containing protein [Bacteroidota bacterium]
MKKIFFSAIFLIFSFGYAQQIWFEGFESTTFPPTGWSILDISGIKIWERYTDNPHSGTGCARHDFANASYGLQETALVTPSITLPNYGTPILEFWSYIQLIGYQYSGVLISTTVNNNINAFTEVKVLSGPEIELGTWKKISIPLNNYLGQTIYIAFLYKNTDGHRWSIDDIAITHFESFVDMQTVSITPATGTYPVLSASEQITVRLKNNGGAAASGFNVKLLHNDNLMATETFTGSIPSLGEASYTFNATLNLSATATHKIQAIVVMPGDQVPANDMVTAMVTNLGCNTITTFPFVEGFENNGENLPSCWTQEIVQGAINWRVIKSSTFIPNMDPDEAFEGDYRAVFFVGGYDHITKLITPPLNLTSLGNPVLKFHHIQQRWDGDQDSLKVYYRTSTHSPWILLEKYTEEVVNWTERVIPLPNPSNEYYIAFEGYHNYARSVQIDNVKIGHFFNTDISVKNITPNGTHLNLSNHQEITATIKNNGRNPVSGFTLSLFVNENIIATETYSGAIPGMGEINYTFNATVDLSVSGRYALKVVVNLPGDEIPENNMLTVIVRNLVCDALTFPHDEGFEEYVFPPYCWTTSGPGWERRTYGAHTGIGRAVYPWWEGTQGWLISPKFSIPEDGNFIMEFWSKCYEARFYVYSGVWISTTNNNPSSFTEVHELTGNERPEDEWVKIEIPLNSYAGQDIYIAFKYRNNGNESGHMWSIDDFNILDLNPRIDAELVAITAPPSMGINMTSEEPVTVQIKNNGGSIISGFQLILEHNGSVVATETFTGYIPSLVTANYTFTKRLDLSAAGNHTLKVTVVVVGDMVPDNNFKTKIVENRICPVVTSFPWYGEFQGDAAGTIADCWINTDADSDTKKWYSLEETGKYYAVSESYDTYYEFPLTPDNWLITPPLALNHTCSLSYKVGGALSNEKGAEKYSVLISTTNVTPTSFTPIHTETLTSYDYTELLSGALAGYGVKTINIPLAAYIGKTVHIAFRHWDCTGQDKLMLKDIQVNEELSVIDISGKDNTLIAWTYGNKLYIKELRIGERFNLYSVTGQLIYTNIAHSEIMSVPLNTRGFYIIQSGSRAVKVVY